MGVMGRHICLCCRWVDSSVIRRSNHLYHFHLWVDRLIQPFANLITVVKAQIVQEIAKRAWHTLISHIRGFTPALVFRHSFRWGYGTLICSHACGLHPLCGQVRDESSIQGLRRTACFAAPHEAPITVALVVTGRKREGPDEPWREGAIDLLPRKNRGYVTGQSYRRRPAAANPGHEIRRTNLITFLVGFRELAPFGFAQSDTTNPGQV